MKNKGFTLVELLAVIAILAILVIVAMPNVLEMFNQAKVNTFVTEVQKIMDTSTSQFTQDAIKNSGQTVYYSSVDNPELKTSQLNISGAEKDYFIEMDRNGNFKRIIIYDDNYCYDVYTYYGNDSIGNVDDSKSQFQGNKIEKNKVNTTDIRLSGNDENIIVVSKEGNNIVSYKVKGCDTKSFINIEKNSNTGLLGNKDEIKTQEKHCIYNGELTQGATYTNGQYTYKYKMGVSLLGWGNISEDGWGVKLTDSNSTAPVTTQLCSTINGKPIVSLSGTFFGSDAVSVDLTGFDSSKVKSMHMMFYKSKIKNINFGNFDTKNVTNMSSMFYNSEATNFDISSFDTSKVTNMGAMFSGAYIEKLDLSHFNTSKVTNMRAMFSDAKVTNLNISNFDTSNVTDMVSMFWKSKLETLDLSSFNFNKVETFNTMFSLSNLKTVYVKDQESANILIEKAEKNADTLIKVK